MCGCHGFDLTQGDDYKTISAALKLSELTSGLDDFEEDVQREVVSILCSSVLGLGEQTQVSVLSTGMHLCSRLQSLFSPPILACLRTY